MSRKRPVSPKVILLVVVFIAIALLLQVMLHQDKSFKGVVTSMISDSEDRQCFMVQVSSKAVETEYKLETLGDKFCLIKETGSEPRFFKNAKIEGFLEEEETFPVGLKINKLNDERVKVRLVPFF